MLKYKNFFIPLVVSIFLIAFIHESSYFKTQAVLNSIEYKDLLNFYITSDIHFLSKQLMDYGKAFEKFMYSGDGKQIDYIPEIFDAFIYDIKLNSPDFLLISGDLTINGEKQSHYDLAKKLKEIEALGTDVYVIPGNHDINNPHARSFSGENQIKTSTITPNDFSVIYNEFGFEEAISKDTNSLSYLIAPSSDLWILMLDSNLYQHNMTINYPEGRGMISSKTLKWIKKCSDLAKKNEANLIAVSHHNLLDHSDLINDSFTLDNNSEVIKVFESCNIPLLFSGHIHMQSIKNVNVSNSDIYDIANTSLAIYPQKFGVCNYSGKTLSFNTKELDVAKYAIDNSIDDNILKDFKAYSKKFFSNLVLDNAVRNISFDKSVSDSQLAEMSETLLNIRLKYESSLDNLTWDEIINSNGFEDLKKCSSPFIKHYINIALEGDEKNNNTLNLNFN